MFLDKKTLLKIWLTPGLNLTMFRVTGPRNTSSRNPDSHLRLESRIQVPMTNEMKYYKKVPMRKTGIQYTWNPESTAWNPESKTVMDSLARGETNGQKIQYIFTGSFTSSPRVSHEPRFHVLFLDQTFMTLLFYFQPPGQSWRIKPWLFGNPESVQTTRNWDVAKERLLLSFILSKGYKVKFLKSFAKKGMYLMRNWRNTLDWKLSDQKIRRRLL